MLSKRQNNPVRVYEPNHIMKAGIRVWAEMFRELADFRSLFFWACRYYHRRDKYFQIGTTDEETRSELGMNWYEVRNFAGWNHHILTYMLAYFSGTRK